MNNTVLLILLSCLNYDGFDMIDVLWTNDSLSYLDSNNFYFEYKVGWAVTNLESC